MILENRMSHDSHHSAFSKSSHLRPIRAWQAPCLVINKKQLWHLTQRQQQLSQRSQTNTKACVRQNDMHIETLPWLMYKGYQASGWSHIAIVEAIKFHTLQVDHPQRCLWYIYDLDVHVLFNLADFANGKSSWTQNQMLLFLSQRSKTVHPQINGCKSTCIRTHELWGPPQRWNLATALGGGDLCGLTCTISADLPTNSKWLA